MELILLVKIIFFFHLAQFVTEPLNKSLHILYTDSLYTYCIHIITCTNNFVYKTLGPNYNINIKIKCTLNLFACNHNS